VQSLSSLDARTWLGPRDQHRVGISRDREPVSIAYRASKMGIIGLTRALSATLGDEGITINAVVASLTNTAMAEGVPEAIVNDSVGRQVIHRMAEPGDIAGAVVLVASDEAGWITGQSILANGGNAFSI